jgi:3,4-dehydroadipyl-CoA semialdehyde dehydrogenase
MKTLRSHVCGAWHAASEGFVPLVNPSTEEQVARASSAGIDFGAVLEHARSMGGPALRAMTFAERGALLKGASKLLREHRDELLALSRDNNGTTKPDGSFDVDGATGTLAFYSLVGKKLGDRKVLADGDGLQLGRSDGFWSQHAWLPRRGVAVHINAFNFPAWGWAEKAACAWLAGMPVVTKPATATALVAERMVEILLEAGILPEGTLQSICGGTGDLLERLGPQDVVAFTGSADTARELRTRAQRLPANPRFNVEADSLNAAVLAPDVDPGGDGVTWELFTRDVIREITQKAGQKCTAVRRIGVPRGGFETVRDALAARLAEVVTGNPADASVTMGPLATAAQLEDAERGVAELTDSGARIVHGTGQRADGAGSPAGKGYFFPPVLVAVEDDDGAGRVHEREVFAPVATLLPYDGTAETAAELVARGGGTLVTSVYSDDPEWRQRFVARGGATTGRLYIGSEESAGDAFGSGAALPGSLHGGPGRAGGGEELGGMVGVTRYMQRLALQGGRSVVEGLAELGSSD